MIAFAAFSGSHELGRKVKTYSALAPVATVSHIKGAMKVLAGFSSQLEVRSYYNVKHLTVDKKSAFKNESMIITIVVHAIIVFSLDLKVEFVFLFCYSLNCRDFDEN